MARGSLAEMRTQLLIAQRLDFLNESDAAPTFQRIDEFTRQLAALHRAIERAATNGRQST
jgi:four helix bundle protein